MQHLLATFAAMADSCLIKLCLANMILMPHVAVHEVQGLATLAHKVHQDHIVCSQLIHISNVLLPKHILSRSIRCLDNDTCSLQTCIRNTTDLQDSAP